MNEHPLALVPELCLLIGAVLTLLVGAFAPRDRQWLARLLAASSLATTLVTAGLAATGADRTIYAHSYALDVATTAGRLIVPAAALLIVMLAGPRVGGDRRETEFYVLVLLASLGAVVLSGASDLLVLAVGYLLASIPLYALAGWNRDPAGAEAALKTYLLGALHGIVMLFGITLIYAVGGGRTSYAALATGLPGAPGVVVATGVVAILAGLLFKSGAVPAHFWVPDAAQGAITPAATLLTTVPKIGGLIAMFRFLSIVPTDVVDWPLLVAALAVASMTLGNFAAFTQQSARRLLGYSTISQVGYLMMAVAVAGRTDRALPALLVYLAGYAVTNVGAFAVVAAVPGPDTIDSYRGLGQRRPGLAAALVICLLGLVGTPPTAVFVGKLTVFTAAWDGGFAWLVGFAAVNTVASLFYYLRWLRAAFSPPQPVLGAAPAAQAGSGWRSPYWISGTVTLAGAGALVVGAVLAPLLTGTASLIR